MNRLEDIGKLLAADKMLYSSHLKMMEEYGGRIECVFERDAGGWGAALLIPVPCSSFDTELYPAAAYMVYLAGGGETIAARVLNMIPKDRDLVFKLQTAEYKELVEKSFPLEWKRALLAYTCPSGSAFGKYPEVERSGRMDERLLPLWLKNGYRREDVERYFGDGAQSFSIYGPGGPVSTCLIFRNCGNIWEIGALHTLESERGKGHARRVVSAALNAVLDAGNVPKYQVVQTNLASVKLAESLGLRMFLRLDHWYYRSGEALDKA